MSNCPFCDELLHKTEWYYVDGPIHVVRDLHDRGYDYRILVVGIGPEWHGVVTKEIRKKLHFHGANVVLAHLANGMELVEIDDEHFSIPDHFHVQYCMERK